MALYRLPWGCLVSSEEKAIKAWALPDVAPATGEVQESEVCWFEMLKTSVCAARRHASLDTTPEDARAAHLEWAENMMKALRKMRDRVAGSTAEATVNAHIAMRAAQRAAAAPEP